MFAVTASTTRPTVAHARATTAKKSSAKVVKPAAAVLRADKVRVFTMRCDAMRWPESRGDDNTPSRSARRRGRLARRCAAIARGADAWETRASRRCARGRCGTSRDGAMRARADARGWGFGIANRSRASDRGVVAHSRVGVSHTARERCMWMICVRVCERCAMALRARGAAASIAGVGSYRGCGVDKVAHAGRLFHAYGVADASI